MAPKRLDYAERLKGPQMKKIRPVKKNIVLVYQDSNDKGEPKLDSEATKKAVREVAKPQDDFIQVRNVRKVRKGGVLIETASSPAA